MFSQFYAKFLLSTSFYTIHNLYHFLPSCAAQETYTNRTIDDYHGDLITGFIPKYSPSEQWGQGTADNNHCLIRPSPSQFHDGTWHYTTFHQGIQGTVPPTITIQFTGTAVYVFNALANHVIGELDAFTNMTFSLDGETVGKFVQTPTFPQGFQYNVPVYANQSLENTDHELVIKAAVGRHPSLILFDYVVYTFKDESNAQSSQQGPQSTSSSSKTSTSSSILSSDLTSATFPITVATMQPEAAKNLIPKHTTGRASAITGGVVGLATIIIAIIAVVRFRQQKRSNMQTTALCAPLPFPPSANDPTYSHNYTTVLHDMMKGSVTSNRSNSGAEASWQASDMPFAEACRLTRIDTGQLNPQVAFRIPSPIRSLETYTSSPSISSARNSTYVIESTPSYVATVGRDHGISPMWGPRASREGGSVAQYADLGLPNSGGTWSTSGPRLSSPARSQTQSLGEAVLRSQISVLEKEVARLRDQREGEDVGDDAPPPLYGEVVGLTR